MRFASRENSDMGRVTTEALIENLGDLWDVEQGRLASDKVRRASVQAALVDTGASTLSLPTGLIQMLGLKKDATRQITTAKGKTEADRYSAVKLTIQGRDATVDVLEVPDDVPVLVGQIPLEIMDFVVDSVQQRLIGNPAHGGEWVMEMY
jgi:predicted aspartyl protease